MATRWGIASSGKISQDFVNALSTYDSGHTVVAVAARSLDSAKEFAEKHNIPKAYGGMFDIFTLIYNDSFIKDKFNLIQNDWNTFL